MHVGAALAVAEHPAVLPGFVELVEVPGNDPGLRLVLMAEPRPLVGERPQVVIQRAEYLGGYLCPVVGGPAPNDRVEPFDHRLSVGPAQGPQLGAEPLPDPSLGRPARFDQRLAAVPADVEPQEVKGAPRGAMRKEMKDIKHLVRAGCNASPGPMQRPGEAEGSQGVGLSASGGSALTTWRPGGTARRPRAR